VTESPGYAVECRVGRLVEARLLVLHSPQQAGAFAEALRTTFLALGRPCVICADWRTSSLLAPEVADALVDLLRRGNPHIERSGVLLAEGSAVFTLQVERVIREARNPSRRVFRRKAPMRAWLSEILEPDEVGRLAEFLADGPPES
jgi:hypothetical protein